jgi:hypothetical protein
MVYTGTEAWEESFMAMWVKMSKSAAAPEKALEGNLGQTAATFLKTRPFGTLKLSPPHGPSEAQGASRPSEVLPDSTPCSLSASDALYAIVTLGRSDNAYRLPSH